MIVQPSDRNRGVGPTLGEAVTDLQAALQPPRSPEGHHWATGSGCQGLLDLPGNHVAEAMLEPEGFWKMLPQSGDMAWRSTRNGPVRLLRVARLQEALSAVCEALQQAMDNCNRVQAENNALGQGTRQLAHPNVSPAAFASANNAVPQTVTQAQVELAALRAEEARQRQEEAMLAETLESAEEEIEALQQAAPIAAAQRRLQSQEMANEAKTTMALLAALKDVALEHREAVLPSDWAQMSPEQQVVACFLDEVEVCQAEKQRREQ